MRLATMRRPSAMLNPSCPSRRKTNLNTDTFFKITLYVQYKPAVSRHLHKQHFLQLNWQFVWHLFYYYSMAQKIIPLVLYNCNFSLFFCPLLPINLMKYMIIHKTTSIDYFEIGTKPVVKVPLTSSKTCMVIKYCF